MWANQEIAFLLADYAVRVIAARHFPELTELKPIRSIETANTAYTAAYATTDAAYYARNVAYYAALTAAITADAANAANINVNYIIDMRQLINIAIDPDRYW